MTSLFSGITAVVLAGGLGSRLRPAVSDRPKVLAVINDRPFLLYLLDCLAAAGVQKVVICAGYLAGQVSETIGSRYRDMELHYSVEITQLGTGGALRLALPLLDSERLLVSNGDSFFDADLEAFLNLHQSAGAAVSLLLAAVADAGRFGAVDLAPDSSVIRFEEKELNRGSGLINAGIYLLERSVVEGLPPGVAISLEKEVFPALAGNGLYGFPQTARFIDIGTPADYHAAAAFFHDLTKRSRSSDDHQ